MAGFFSSFFVGVSLTLRELCRIVFGSFRGVFSFEGGFSPFSEPFFGGFLRWLFSSFFVGVRLVLRELCRAVFDSF